jgi:Fe-S-cluster-containing hydrogenase component 2
MQLNFISGQCIGCKLCQLACSAKHEEVFNPTLARLQISSLYNDKNGEQMLEVKGAVCTNCLECVKACPVEAISFSRVGIILNEEKCNGCMMCQEACPENVIIGKGDVVGICNMCGGNPACVQWCPREALTVNQSVEEVG